MSAQLIGSALSDIVQADEDEKMGCVVLPLTPEPRDTVLWRPRVERYRMKVPEEAVKAIRACQTAESPWPLLMWGPTGTGKTCAALCVLDRVKGFTALEDVTELVSKVFQANYRDLRTEDGFRVFPNNIWSWWERAVLAVLDDLGAKEKVSDSHYDTVKWAIDKRAGRPLIITTNLSPAQIAEVYDDRIASRCVAGTVVKVEGPDRRLK